MKNTHTTTSARRTPLVQTVRHPARPTTASARSITMAAFRTSASLTSLTPRMAIALWTCPYLPCRSSHLGDSGIWVRNTSPMRAGTAPSPSTSRQPTLAALAGNALKMISAMM